MRCSTLLHGAFFAPFYYAECCRERVKRLNVRQMTEIYKNNPTTKHKWKNMYLHNIQILV